MSSLVQERRAKAFELDTTPEYVTLTAERGWYNLEQEMSTNGSFGRELVHPLVFIDRVTVDPRFPLDLTALQLGRFYIYANPIVHEFLMGFLDDQPESGIWQLNEYLRPKFGAMDEALTEAVTGLWATLREYIQLARENEEILEAGIRQCFDEQVAPGKVAFRAQFQEEQANIRELAQFTGAATPGRFLQKSVVRVYRVLDDTRIRDLNQWFDRAKVSLDVPLIVTHDFHKVLKGHTYALQTVPRAGWMYLWTDFGRVEVQEPKEENGAFFISYNVKSAEAEENELAYLRVICAALDLEADGLTREASRINGSLPVAIPGISFSVDLWRDLLLNDARVQPWFVIDETQLTRERESNPNPDEFTELDLIEGGDAGNRIPHVYLPEEIMFQLEVQPAQLILHFLRVDSSGMAQQVAQRLAEIVGVYARERQTLLRKYILYTDADTMHWMSPTITAVPGRRAKPLIYKVFGKNYSRAVGGKVPSLWSEEEANDLQQRGIPVLPFPKPRDLEPGEMPMYFSCHERPDGYTFPGLMLNSKPGSSKYPLLPCCYKVDQFEKKNFNTYEYYRGVPEMSFADFRARQKDRSFLEVDAFQPCSDSVTDLYLLNGFLTPVRRGMHRSPQSALECVLYALDVNGFRAQTADNRLAIVEQEFARLPTAYPYHLALCAQEAWDQPQFPTSDDYFDLRIWIRLVEVAYRCRVVMLSPNDFIFPRHVQGRWLWTPNRDVPVVVLYENRTRVGYPQCEWITFPESVGRSEAAQQHQFVGQYALDASGSMSRLVAPETLFPALSDEKFQLESQHLDFYGKAYAWNVRRGRTKYTFVFRKIRLPPVHIPRATQVFTGRPGNETFFQLGDHAVRVYTEPFPESLLETYDRMRIQVGLLVEQAKFIYARRCDAGIDPADWSFIRVGDPAEAYRLRNRFFFENTDVLVVPNLVTKERLQFVLSMFRRRNESKLMAYMGTTTIPFPYRTISDFQIQDNAVVMGNQRVIQWNKLNYTARDLREWVDAVDDPDAESTPFFTRFESSVYRCVSYTDALPSIYRLFAPQTHQIWIVGTLTPSEQLETFMGVKTRDQTVRIYRCVKIN